MRRKNYLVILLAIWQIIGYLFYINNSIIWHGFTVGVYYG